VQLPTSSTLRPDGPYVIKTAPADALSADVIDDKAVAVVSSDESSSAAAAAAAVRAAAEHGV
jgi:hypothetical protein